MICCQNVELFVVRLINALQTSNFNPSLIQTESAFHGFHKQPKTCGEEGQLFMLTKCFELNLAHKNRTNVGIEKDPPP